MTDLEILLRGLEREGGRLVLSFDVDNLWTCGIEFGQETEDSPMAGGAAYALSNTAAEGLAQLVGETGWSVNST